VQPKRNAKAELKLMPMLLMKQGFTTAQIVTGKLKFYHKALHALDLNADPIDKKRSSNRAEYSHRSVRRRE
jgi:transposase-like protein